MPALTMSVEIFHEGASEPEHDIIVNSMEKLLVFHS